MEQPQQPSDSTNETPVGTSLVVIAREERTVRTTVAFLNRRGIPTKVVTNMNDAVEMFSKKQANMALISVNFPHPKIEMIPTLLNQSFQVDCIIFAEESDRKSNQKLSNTKARHVLFGPCSGPVVLMRVRQIEKENQESENAQNGAAAGSEGAAEKSADDENGAIKVGGGRGEGGDRIQVKSKRKSAEGGDETSNLMQSLGDENEINQVHAEGLERSGGTIVQKGARSSMKSATQSGVYDKSRRGEYAARAFGRAIDRGLQTAENGKKPRLFIPPPPWTTPEKEAQIEAHEEAELLAEAEAAAVAPVSSQREAASVEKESSFERAKRESVERELAKQEREKERAEKKQQAAERAETAKKERDEAKEKATREREERDHARAEEAHAQRAEKAAAQERRNSEMAAKVEPSREGSTEGAADNKVPPPSVTSQAPSEPAAQTEDKNRAAVAAEIQSAKNPDSSPKKSAADPRPSKETSSRLEPVKLREPKNAEESVFLRCVREAMATVCGDPVGVKSGVSKVKAAALVSVQSKKIAGAFLIEVGRSRTDAVTYLQRIEVAFFSAVRRLGIELQQGEQLAIELDDFEIVEKAVEASDYTMISVSADHEVAAAVVPVTRPIPLLEPHADNMLKLQVSDVPIEVSITYDVFLRLPLSNKYVRYLKVGSRMSDKQSNKLGKFQVSHLFLSEEDGEAYRKHYAAQSLDPGKKEKAA